MGWVLSLYFSLRNIFAPAVCGGKEPQSVNNSKFEEAKKVFV